MDVLALAAIFCGGLMLARSVALARPAAGSRILRLLLGVAGAAAITGFATAVFFKSADEQTATKRDVPVVQRTGASLNRQSLRCRSRTVCDDAKEVGFNAYVDNVSVKDERYFFSLGNPWTEDHSVVDSVDLGSRSSVRLTGRVYIDQVGPHLGPKRADARDTRLRLALPTGPVYSARPTAYLSASNAVPKAIWDSAQVYADRPFTLRYVEGSARVDDRGLSGAQRSKTPPGSLTDAEGLRLGDWAPGFDRSGFVTFVLEATALPEPVRDPRATRGFAVPPERTTRFDTASEPTAARTVRERRSCSATHCQGAPYALLNAFINHPKLRDESNFVRAIKTVDVAEGIGDKLFNSDIEAAPGDVLLVRVFADNAADPKAVGASLPNLSAQEVIADISVSRRATVSATLSAANVENPIVDWLRVLSREPIRLKLRSKFFFRLRGDQPGWDSVPMKRRPTIVSRSGSRDFRVSLGDLPPSFARIAYTEFYVEVRDAH